MQHALPPSAVVGVIGAGAMGAGIAQVVAQAGHSVLLLDQRQGAAQAAIDGIAKSLGKLVEKGKLDALEADATVRRLGVVDAYADFSPCALVIEAIVEEIQVKVATFRALEDVVGTDCILATNTSSISVTAIAAGLRDPARLAGLHFFNPAPVMKLVEVVSGLATSAVTAQTLYATATAWGKTAVMAKSTPGFIVNRVARPFYAEALRMLNEGLADCATIDAVMREAGGFRMGPFELMDMIGHDVNFAVTQSVWNAYFGDPRFTPSLQQQELVQSGRLGRKTGQGFYSYATDVAKPEPRTAPACTLAAAVTVYGLHPAAQALHARLQMAGVQAIEAAAQSDALLLACVGDMHLYLSDGRTATERASTTGQRNTVVMDTVLHWASASRVAVAPALQASESAVQQACALLQAAGFAVSVVADRPALMVTRTVAMLANEASDAVLQGVCKPADADAAMQLGVNYPKGPLAWGDAMGAAHVRSVLAHMAGFYGEDRYRISPHIQLCALAGRPLCA